MTTSSSPRLRSTKDYALFGLSKLNRAIDQNHLKKLRASMREFGWIPAFPMLVARVGEKLCIMDGQHRYFIAKEMGLPVWFVETNKTYDIATINSPQVPWKFRDYAGNFAQRGSKDYQEAIDFAERHSIAVSVAAGLLYGHSETTNVRKAFIAGHFQVKDRDFAERVMFLFNAVREITRSRADKSLFLAFVAVARTPGIDCGRLVRNAQKMPERFIKFATRDGALAMLEDVYNFHARGPKVALKIMAENAMKDRNGAAK